MPTLTAVVSADHLPCTCCGCAAQVTDEDHGPLCRECLEELIAIQDYLDSIELQ